MPTAPFCRPATLADLDALLALYRDLNPNDPPLAREDAHARLAQLFDSGIARVLVVEHAGRVAATCTLLVIPNLTRGGRPFAVIENVVAAADLRGQGLGSAVLAHAVESACAADVYKILITTGRTDERVLRFYEKAGFRRGTKTQFELRRI